MPFSDPHLMGYWNDQTQVITVKLDKLPEDNFLIGQFSHQNTIGGGIQVVSPQSKQDALLVWINKIPAPDYLHGRIEW